VAGDQPFSFYRLAKREQAKGNPPEASSEHVDLFLRFIN
jgi:hypothetical protein